MTKRIYLSPPHMGGEEQKYIAEVFRSNFIAPVGPAIDAFENEMARYLDIPFVAAVTSGTAAMHLIMRHLGLKEGDIVFASTLTFIGSVSPVIFERGELVFVDAARSTWNMDPDLLVQGIEDSLRTGRNIKAVVPTDIYGQCTDIERIRSACEPYGIPVIVDSAESLGSKYKGTAAGRGAYASVYSFNGNKIITTSGGGLLASEDGRLIEHAKKLATQARDDFPYYHHTEIGYNYRMSNVTAAIGLGQLKVLEERVIRKREIKKMYQQFLGDIEAISFMPEADHCRANCWLTVVQIDPGKTEVTPEQIRIALEKENIEARPVWKPMHMQPVFQNNKVIGGKVAEDLFLNGLCLPSGTAMSGDDIERVVGVVRDCFYA